MKKNIRFVYVPYVLGILALLMIPFAIHAQATPTVSILANGVTDLVIEQGGSYVLSWNSSNVTSPCTISYVRTDGQPNGSFGVTPNTAGSGGSGLLGSYTITCQSSSGPVSKTAHITLAPPSPPSVTLLVGGTDNLVINLGDSYTIAYGSRNVTGPTCTISYTSAQGNGSFPVDANISGTGGSGLVGSYTMTCQSSQGPLSKTVTITVQTAGTPPTCTLRAMNVSPSDGTATLLWTTQGATSASLDHGVGAISLLGTKSITVASWGEIYRLTVQGPTGTGSCSATIQKKCNFNFSDPPTEQNPCYDVDPQAAFPNTASLLPSGGTYTSIVPDTIDLADRARLYIQATIQSMAHTSAVPAGIISPVSPAIFHLPTSPSGAVNNDLCGGSPPCFEGVGTANWTKVNRGLVYAHEMSGNDVDGSQGTFSKYLQSVVNSLRYSVNIFAMGHSAAGFVLPPQWFGGGPAPIASSMESLSARYREDPSNTGVKRMQDEFVQMFKDTLIPEVKNGQIYYYWYKQRDFNKEYFGGYYGLTDTALQNGRSVTALLEWYNLSGNQDAFDLGSKVNDFLRNASGLWDNPDPSRFTPDLPGQYFGDPHAYMNVALGFLEEARARLKTNAQDPIAKENIKRARDMLEFTKRRTEGGTIGNFGAVGATGDIIRVALGVTELGSYFPDLQIANYYDEVERWMRNELAEKQIDSAIGAHIGNNASANPLFDRIRDKSIGMWLTDSTHALAVPYNTMRYDNDGPANAMRGMYEVWLKSVSIKGDTASIDILMNRASQYLDVKSDLPYRGRIEIDTKSLLGPVRRIAVRTPGWTDRNAVTVTLIDSTGNPKTLAKGTEWFMTPPYALIPNAQAGVAYVVTFPMRAYHLPVVELRDATYWWYESTYSSPTGQAPETRITYDGTFLGYDLVAVDHRPSAQNAVPRYQRNNLAALVSGASVNETAPGTVSRTRFALGGAPPPITISNRPTITRTNTGDIPAGMTVTIIGSGFSSSNVVLLNGAAVATPSSYSSGTRIWFTVPEHTTPGSYNLTVRNENGTSNATDLRVHVPYANWPSPPHASTVDAQMAPYITAGGSGAAAWLQGDTLGNYLYGSSAQQILHGTGWAETGSVAGRVAVPCGDIAQDGLAVILVAGQSNAANSAQADANGQFYSTTNPVYNLNVGDGKCYAAKNPLLGMDGAGQAFALPLASNLIDAGLYKRVLLVPVSVSGTLIEEWRPDGGKHFVRITKAIDYLKTFGLSPTFILWHQGEGNAGEFLNSDTPDGTHIDIDSDVSIAGTLSWMRNLFKMVSSIRNTGVQAPFFVAQATICGGDNRSVIIRKAQESVADPAWKIYAGPDTDVIPFSLRRTDDHCHFSHQGNLEHAKRWYEVIRAYVQPGGGTPTVTLLANGQENLTIPQGGSYTLTWNSSNVSSCTISYRAADGQQEGSFSVAANTSGSGGSGLVGWYMLSCAGNNGQQISKTVTITSGTPPPAAPTVTLTANGQQSATVAPGAPFTIAWSSSNATSCTLTNAQGGVGPIEPNTSGSSGGAGGAAGSVYNYSFTCTNANGSTTKTASVTVISSTSPQITSKNTDDPMTGDVVTITGTGFTDKNDILFDGAIVQIVGSTESGTKLSLLIPTNYPTGSHTYNLTVRNQNGTSNGSPIRVHALLSVSLTANGQQSVTLPPNTNFTIAWSSSNATSCTLTNAQGGVGPITPNTTGSSLGTTGSTGITYTYTLTCTGTNGTQRSQTATVVVQ